MAPLPVAILDSATTYHNGQIIVCGGRALTYISTACWSYSVANNTWLPFLPAMQYSHNRMPSVTYGNKFYAINDGNANEAFDFSINSW